MRSLLTIAGACLLQAALLPPAAARADDGYARFLQVVLERSLQTQLQHPVCVAMGCVLTVPKASGRRCGLEADIDGLAKAAATGFHADASVTLRYDGAKCALTIKTSDVDGACPTCASLPEFAKKDFDPIADIRRELAPKTTAILPEHCRAANDVLTRETADGC